jgi:hypothetical protein
MEVCSLSETQIFSFPLKKFLPIVCLMSVSLTYNKFQETMRKQMKNEKEILTEVT